MRRLLLLSTCCLSLAASAAIITERNDLNIYPPDYATFVGSASHPGIDSCWIPYGTYTDGSGSTEYLRVTSNLVGVVCSAFDGCIERQYYWFQPGDRYLLYPTTNTAYYSRIENVDEFLEPFLLTNNTTRILDLLNTMDRRRYCLRQGPVFYATQYGEYPMLEQYLAREETGDDWDGTHYQCHAGTAAKYGGRKLDALVAQGASIEPPIPSGWTSDLPFKAADSNLWATVWPTYSAVTNDIHFYPAYTNTTQYYNRSWPDWIELTSNEIWGYDIYSSRWWDDYIPGRGYDLEEAVKRMPLPYTMEDVLSADTGWKYEVPPVETGSYWTVSGPLGNFRLSEYYPQYQTWDNWSSPYPTNYYVEITHSENFYGFYIYDIATSELAYQDSASGDDDTDVLYFGGYHAQRTRLFANQDDYIHWTNGTTRLDWKRLGIICQLERQMEQTYEPIYYTDRLPLWRMGTRHELGYQSAPVEITFPAAQYSGQEMGPVAGLFNNASWSLNNDSYHSSTNISEWSTPTCRTPIPAISEGAQFDNAGQPIYLGEENATNLLAFLVSELERYTTNRLVHVGFYGSWGAASGRMALEYQASYSEGVEMVTMPSNTVEVSASDGFSESSWRESPIAQSDWHFGGSGTNFTFRPDSPYSGSATLEYRKSDLTSHLDLDYNKNAGFDFGSDGSVTMPTVTFTAVGGGPVTNWLWRMDGIETFDESMCIRTVTSEGVTWHFNATGADIFYTYGGSYRFVTGTMLDAGSYYVNYESLGEIPSSWTSPSLAATWHPDTCEVASIVTDYGELNPFSVRIGYDSTNDSRVALASITKEAHPTFTWASEDTRTATINMFESSYSALDRDKVHELRRSELELLLCARGASYANDTAPSTINMGNNSFNWQSISNHGWRDFRYLQGTTVQTLQSANNARYNMLANLSAACKTKCADLGGMPIGAIANVGRLTQNERNSFMADLRSATVSGTFIIKGSDADDPEQGEYNGMWIGAEYIDGEWEITALGRVTPPPPPAPVYPYLIGSCGWECFIDYTPSNRTNSYYDVRVDGFQAPMVKTLWKFKNLRDPNL